MPTATDLVTDLPADFEVFGCDTSLADLLGGTTGQVLAKASDFVWTTDAAGMTNPCTIYSPPARLWHNRSSFEVSGGIPAWTTPQ
jgi:hypothetical protein